MAGIGLELAGAGDADIRAVVIHDRRAGAHGGVGELVGVVVQLELAQLADAPRAVFLCHAGAVEVAALRCEVICVRFRVIADAAALVGADALAAVHDAARPAVEHQKLRRLMNAALTRVAALPVVRADQQEIVAHIRACPVKAAGLRMRPGRNLLLESVRRVLIRHGQADKVCIERLTLPEARVEISVIHDDRAVRLAADGVRIEPEGFERLCIKGLNAAV